MKQKNKATGKDFDDVMYRLHVTMAEAARIFGSKWTKMDAKQNSIGVKPGIVCVEDIFAQLFHDRFEYIQLRIVLNPLALSDTPFVS